VIGRGKPCPYSIGGKVFTIFTVSRLTVVT
jgi:hypothetical protein